jgi:hypothetical protein
VTIIIWPSLLRAEVAARGAINNLDCGRWIRFRQPVAAQGGTARCARHQREYAYGANDDAKQSDASGNAFIGRIPVSITVALSSIV